MKKNLSVMLAMVATSLAAVFFVNNSIKSSLVYENQAVAKFEIPSNVQQVFDKSCVACHQTSSTNVKGKMKLNFDDLKSGEMPKAKLLAKLNGISKALNKGTMPPEKFLAKYPDKAVTESEKKLILDWTSAQISSMSSN